jgi:hypothetical protein
MRPFAQYSGLYEHFTYCNFHLTEAYFARARVVLASPLLGHRVLRSLP